MGTMRHRDDSDKGKKFTYAMLPVPYFICCLLQEPAVYIATVYI
jgi:hypothetical protein